VYVCSALKFRQGTHSTINKAAFKGGSRKPWRQKGSGRARAGGADSPIWVGGAIAHGPTPNKNYLRRMSSRSKALALSALLCSRSAEGSLFGLDSSLSLSAKTKDADRVLKSCFSNQNSKILFVISGKDGDSLIARAVRNIPYVWVCEVGKIGVAEVLHTGAVVFTAESLELLPKRFERWL
jgi:large subunit ribosomal protein L4